MSAAPLRAGRTPAFAFGPADHQAIATFAYDAAGIVLPPAKSQLVYGRLAPRVRACGLTRFADYVALIADDGEERTRALEALTTNHTSFFRERHHFDHFLAEVWPALNRRLGVRGKVRLWSAACSSGEEPYSLLMALFGTAAANGQRLAKSDLRVLATDLSTDILSAASAGSFAPDTAMGVPAPLRSLWMRRDGDRALVHPLIRDRVAFRKLNLLGEWPMRGTFDAIFCRNVMIYFDEPTKETLQRRLAAKLAPGGFLYIGHSERLAASIADSFECVGRTTFRKVA
jgi:chemotaxis protein methyltransferase CheR